jgi:hypothetical protein
VRKAKLLSTVAAALLLSAGAASAQGMGKDTPERAPAAQQNAPAEKVAPSIKNGDQKAPQTTGQAAPDAKSGKAKETTGQAPKSDADQKAQTPSRSMDKGAMDKDSKPGAATDKSDAKSGSKTEQNAQSPSDTSKSTQTTGQGAAGSAKLSTEQRTKITSVIREQKVERVNLNVSVSVGTRIPTNVRLHALPQQVIVIYPEWRGYEYILVGDQIVVINPRTHEIVAVLDA